MHKSEKVTAVLAAAMERFPPISGKSMDSDISLMCKVLTPILKGVNCDPVESTHNIWGIVAPADKYLSSYNAVFAVPVGRLLFYATIPEDAPNSVLRQLEAEHTT